MVRTPSGELTFVAPALTARAERIRGPQSMRLDVVGRLEALEAPHREPARIDGGC